MSRPPLALVAGVVYCGAGLAVSVEGHLEVPDGMVLGRAGEEGGKVWRCARRCGEGR